MVFAWSLSEIVRYGFYLSSNPLVLGKSTPQFLIWLRYSLFYILYPAGVSGELGVIYQSLPEIGQVNINLGAVSFPLSYIFYLILAVYIPGMFPIVRHLFNTHDD